MHIFDTCSKSCGDEEGYGQRRICLSCASSAGNDQLQRVQQVAKELAQTEKWSKKKRQTRSYLAPVPNWNINQRAQSKPQISILSNASQSSATYNFGKKNVALKNTCGPDSILQVCF